MIRDHVFAAVARQAAPFSAVGLIAVVLISSFSCTDADLELIPPPLPFRDDKVTVYGDFCTTSPASKVFPLRVLFVVDGSESMRVTDPPDPVTMQTGRERAVQAVWEELLRGDPEGVRIGLMRFAAESQPLTATDVDGDGLTDSYFTTDRARLSAGTSALASTGRTTNYLTALSEAYFELRSELQVADQESLPLSKYVVVFVSDGIPDVDSNDERQNTRENILDSVEQLNELARIYRLGDFSFHTAYLSAGEGPALDKEAQELLQDMAELGGGNFRSFPSGESINFLFVDFNAIRRVFTLKTLSAVNINTVVDAEQVFEYFPRGVFPVDGGIDGGMVEAGVPVLADAGLDGGADAGPPAYPTDRNFTDVDGNELPSCGEFLVDTDGDGLADLKEAQLGTAILVPDSDDDGLDDTLEWRFASSGFDPLDPTDARCFVPDVCENRDADGLCDCLIDLNVDGVCDCAVDPEYPCSDLGATTDCVDLNMDGFCDCPDLDQDERCDYPDRDGDKINNCQEIFYGTAQNGNDTDADGLPDLLEIRVRSNAIEKDLMSDGDWDAVRTGNEVLSSTDPWCDESASRSFLAQQYEITSTGIDGDRSCYAFDIRNITVVPTAENPGAAWPGNGWNRLLLFAGEVAFDDPEAFASYRIACAMVYYDPDGNYKSPPSGRIRFVDTDFVEFRDFDPDSHCRWP